MAPGAAAGHSHGPRPSAVPGSLRAERLTSFDPADFPVPRGREEEWRFTPVKALGTLLADEPAPGCLQLDAQLPVGVTQQAISGEQARALGIMAPGDRPAALAADNPHGATQVDIPAEADLADPVRINLTGTGERVDGHLVVTVGEHAEATVIISHDGRGALNELVSVVAADGAHVTVVSVQDWQGGSVHLGEHDMVVGADAYVRHIGVTLGGDVVRLNANVRYAGPGGEAQLLGVYFADAGQHLEQRSFVDHEAKNCVSRVAYKGALQGRTARTVWVGDVLIRAEAEGTDTYEINRNLVLTDGARADSVPNLEIETGQIEGAGHAAATGRFDDEQLFYLMARGIRQEDARRLVVRGFFADIIARIGVPEVVDKLMAAIEAELELHMTHDG
ncbi:MAG: Fe-S cluster assembly protein SufD [Micrococcales bacterium]|nr:MAG: Fe-S cluster assembly protein SufD [Micrococcales bacterium]